MSFETREISNQDGNIVSLYEFRWGETVWRYTSADQTITITIGTDDFDFEPIAISDNGMVQGGSANNDLTVEVQQNIPLVDLFRSTPPAGEIALTVRRRHQGDDADDWFVWWIGTVANVKKGRVSDATIIGRTLLHSFRRTGLRLSWTRGCPHMLYDSECRVNPADFGHATTITAINSDGTISVASAGGRPAGYYDGGFLEWAATTEGTLDQRSIESSATATRFRIFGSTDRLQAGMSITIYPGCDLTGTTCAEKFNNLANYGGFEQMTGDNPFDGRNVF